MTAPQPSTFASGAELAAQLLTGAVSLPADEFDWIGHIFRVLNDQNTVEHQLHVTVMALHQAVNAHARHLRQEPPAGGIDAYLLREGAELSDVLTLLDSLPPRDDPAVKQRLQAASRAMPATHEGPRGRMPAGPRRMWSAVRRHTVGRPRADEGRS